jgi:hypothetical protein
MNNSEFTVDMAREFHRRMAAIIDAVQSSIWEKGGHYLLGYTTDFGFGQKRGMQTLDLKTGHRSAHIRLLWDTILGDTPADRHLVDEAVAIAVNELT